jgi:hypothetical protein
MRAARVAASLAREPPSVNVRWCAPLVVTIVIDLVTRIRAGFGWRECSHGGVR